MRGTIRQLGTLTAMMVTSLVFPSLVAAQVTSAQALEARAALTTDVPRGIAKAAQLLVKAAQLRAPGDPAGVGDLIAAAGGFYSSGKLTQARTTAEQAGERALAMGDVVQAARAFNVAALVANEQGDPARDQLIARARLLASSPLIGTDEKVRIVSQFKPAGKPPVQVAAQK